MVRMIVVIAIINGVFSPFVFTLFQAAPVWLPYFALGHLQVVIYLCSIAVTTLTLLFAGVPAALYERFTGTETEEGMSAWIWFAGVIVLSLPTLHAVLTNGVTLF